jgi:hypothetical protein
MAGYISDQRKTDCALDLVANQLKGPKSSSVTARFPKFGISNWPLTRRITSTIILFLSLYPVLSSTSFDRVRLRGTHWVIEFDRNNIHPGMQARLAKEKFPEDISQVWVVNK